MGVPAHCPPTCARPAVSQKRLRLGRGLHGYFELHSVKIIFSFDQFGGKFSVSVDESSHRLVTAHLAKACWRGHVGSWSFTGAQCPGVKPEPAIGLPLPAVQAGAVPGPEPPVTPVLAENESFILILSDSCTFLPLNIIKL